MKQRYQIDVSAWTIIKIVLVLLGFWLLFLIKDVIILLLFAVILSATFRPVVNAWEKKIKRVPAVIAILLILIAVLVFISYIIFPPLIKQIESLINNAPTILDKFKFLAPYKSILVSGLQSVAKDLGSITGGFVSATVSIFGGLFSTIITFVLTVYLLLDQDGFKKFITAIVPSESKNVILGIAKKMASKMGSWFRGQMLLGLIAGVVYYIALTIIGLPYALTIGLLSGILDFVPTIGPMIAGFIAVIVALTISPIHALIVLVLYIVVQQLENNILVPKIMEKAVGLSPIVIIIAITICSKLLGLVGAIIAVPLSALIVIVIQEWPNIKATFQTNEK